MLNEKKGENAPPIVKLRIIPEYVSLSIHFKVQEPIVKKELLDLLTEHNFEEISGKPERIFTEVGVTERVNIAKKRGCIVNYNTSIGRIGVSGDKYSETFTTFKELESLLKEEEIFTEVKFYEFSSRNKVRVKNGKIIPLESIARFVGSDKLSEFQKIVDIELIPFSIRLCPKEKIRVLENFKETIDWFDLYIFPFISNPRYFAVWLVFRSKEGEEVKKFAQNAEGIIEKAIKIIGGGEKSE